MAADADSPAQADGDGTVLPLYLDPKTKLFLVALMWCRPWLLDPSAASPLPRTPEIARAALEVTGAHHELERFDTDPEFRDRLSARVAEHLKVLRRKITERGLAGPEVRLSDEVAVRILIEHGVVGAWRPAPAHRSRVVLPAGGPVVGQGVTGGPSWPGGGPAGRGPVDAERGAGAAPAGSGHHHRVRSRRNRPAEEVVSLVDRVVERALPGRSPGGPVRRPRRPGCTVTGRTGQEAAAVEDVHRVAVAVGLADAQLWRGAGRLGRARRPGCTGPGVMLLAVVPGYCAPAGSAAGAEPCSAIPSPVPAASRTTAAIAPAHHGARGAGAAGRGPRLVGGGAGAPVAAAVPARRGWPWIE